MHRQPLRRQPPPPLPPPPVLQAALCEVRRAADGFALSRATQRVLRACAAGADGAEAEGGGGGGGEDGAWVRLFATNGECDRLNERRLRALPGAARRYAARDTGDERHLTHLRAPPRLDLKVGDRHQTSLEISRDLALPRPS